MSNPNESAAPRRYEEGFTGRTMLGVFFIAIVMVPGSLYLNLVAGSSLAGAAEWVTIILFVELARRSLVTLKRQEIYLLFYVAAALMASESASLGPLWSQYLVQSSAARDMGIAAEIPHWVAPAADSVAMRTRTLLHRDWVPALLLLAVGMVLSRISWIGMSYFLFRLTADTERLPFPLAPIAAEGATALAESSRGEEGWRWRWFSIGAVIGLLFGSLYVGVPALTSAAFGTPVHILPIPWVDLTQATERVLPATAIGFTVSLGAVIAGLVLPYWVVVGTCVGALAMIVVNPILHRVGMLPTWHLGMDTVQTMFANSVDFWLSFGLGTTLAVAAVGIVQTVKALRRAGVRPAQGMAPPPPGRGDFSPALALGAFALATSAYILLCKALVPGFPWLFFVFFGFVFTPLNSYINARMIGISGQFTGIPFVAEGTYILSGYEGAAIWFAPVPLQNHGGYVQRWREVELTGTKFTSMLKAEAFMLPVILVSSLLFWSLLWKLGPIPSPAYPYAQKMWHLQALNQCLWISGTHGQGAPVVAGNEVYLLKQGRWLLLNVAQTGVKAPAAVVRDGRGDLWIGAENGLWRRRKSGELERITPTEGELGAVRSLVLDPQERLVVAAEHGIYRWSPAGLLRLFAQPVRRVAAGRQDELWCDTGSELLRLDERGAETVAFHVQITVLAVDRQGRVWVGDEQGLRVFDGWEWTQAGDDYPAAGEPVVSLALTNGGRLWVATPSDLWRRGEYWERVEWPAGLSGAPVLIDTVNEELWLATTGGLYRRYGERWEALHQRPGAPELPVTAIDAAPSTQWLLTAIKPGVITAGLAVGLGCIAGMGWLGWPVMAVYGFVRSLGSIPHLVLPEIIGALAGRYYFSRKFGEEQWRRYTPVLAAGFACGMGLIGMMSVALVLAAKAVIASPY